MAVESCVTGYTHLFPIASHSRAMGPSEPTKFLNTVVMTVGVMIHGMYRQTVKNLLPGIFLKKTYASTTAIGSSINIFHAKNISVFTVASVISRYGLSVNDVNTQRRFSSFIPRLLYAVYYCCLTARIVGKSAF